MELIYFSKICDKEYFPDNNYIPKWNDWWEERKEKMNRIHKLLTS